MQAPHISFWIVARGINLGLNTRMYFSDEAEANAARPAADPHRLPALSARHADRQARRQHRDVRHHPAGSAGNRVLRHLIVTTSPFDHPYLSALLGDDEIAGQFLIEEDYEYLFYFEEALSRAARGRGPHPRSGEGDRAWPLRARSRRAESSCREGRCHRAGIRAPAAGVRSDRRRASTSISARPARTSSTRRWFFVFVPSSTPMRSGSRRLAAAFASLEDKFGDNALMGVTRMQDALPITVARSHRGMARSASRVTSIGSRRSARGSSSCSSAEPSATLDKLGGKGMAVARRVADKLDLGLPEHSWHNQRDNLAEFASGCRWSPARSASSGRTSR